MRKILFFLVALAMLLPLSCGGGQHAYDGKGDTIQMHYAKHLSMVDYGDFVTATFRNPWDTTKTLQTFILVPRDKEVPSDLPEGTVLRVPLQKSVVYTTVHVNLINELQALAQVAGVCDHQYIYNQKIRSAVANKSIADCGSSMSPNIEQILMLSPDAILLSAFENSNDHNKVGQTGVPIIDCIDYLEPHPLGRAEWLKFFGRLYGQGALGDSLYNEVEKKYLEIKKLAASAKGRPQVLVEKIWGQSWTVAGAGTITDILIRDAGGSNPFGDSRYKGFMQVSPEEVLYRAKNADVWLVKYGQATPLTLAQLGQERQIYTKFRPFATGNIYGCNTQTTDVFDATAFHPEKVLAEYVAILHPELGEIPGNCHYHKKLEP